MTPKTKVVDVRGQKYQIRRMRPDVGSFILARVLAAMSGGASSGPMDTAVIGQSSGVFLRGLDFATFSFIQNHALSVVAKLEDDAPVPVVSDSGIYVDTDMESDLVLVMALTVQSVVFNLADFFSDGGLSTILPAQSLKPSSM